MSVIENPPDMPGHGVRGGDAQPHKARHGDWLVGVFETAPVIDDPQWEAQGPYRVVLCPDVSLLRRTRRGASVAGGVRPDDMDVWVVPATQVDMAQVHRCGPMIVVCEIDLPSSLFGSIVEPLIEGRHSFTVRLIERLGGLAGRSDVTGVLLTHMLADALRAHLVDRFMSSLRRQGLGPVEMLTSAEHARILDYVEREGLAGEVSVAALAAYADMSVDRFARAFVATFHVTPHQFVLDRRIAYAKTLLMTSTKSVAEISVAAGFSSHSHFTTTFRNRVGVTPTQYRRR